MPNKKSLIIDRSQEIENAKYLPRPPICTSYQAGWKNIYLAHYQLPVWEIPEIFSLQHTIMLIDWKRSSKMEIQSQERIYQIQSHPNRPDCIDLFPANIPIKAKWDRDVEFTHCYLEAKFLTHAAYELVNPDRVELNLVIQRPDPLVSQMVLRLKAILEQNPLNSSFYAESIATALAAHCLQFYSNCHQTIGESVGGLPSYKLKQALGYMHDRLDRDISLIDLAAELNMSQYHFCRLFKQSLGLAPHQYLIQQRIERSKQLLKQMPGSILDVAIECGFANSSHFAKFFRRQTGLSPKEFQRM